MSKRRVFIDVGANVGKVSSQFAGDNPEHEIYCIEPNRSLIPHIHSRAVEAGRLFTLIGAAAWLYDGYIEFYESGHNAASTIVPGKVEHSGWPQINYQKFVRVPCIDFSDWLFRSFDLRDEITIKMDVEGAEYDLLERMIADRSILLARKMIVEWHVDRYPSVSQERHNNVRREVARLTVLEDWK